MQPNAYENRVGYGYALAVPAAQREGSRQVATESAQLLCRRAVVAVSERGAVKCQDETGRLSWTVWPATATRDQGQALFMAHIHTPKQTPPDRQRMIFGGLRERVSARRIGRPALAKTPLPPPSTEQLCC
ncbi:hypothetical protein [Ottowia oryzae]